jgi:hypothetical protein
MGRVEALAEVAKVRETAERLANGESPAEADHVRMLAGLIHQLAEQVERLGEATTRHDARDEPTPPPHAAVGEPTSPEEAAAARVEGPTS